MLVPNQFLLDTDLYLTWNLSTRADCENKDYGTITSGIKLLTLDLSLDFSAFHMSAPVNNLQAEAACGKDL